jgi:hypothetical protein
MLTRQYRSFNALVLSRVCEGVAWSADELVEVSCGDHHDGLVVLGTKAGDLHIFQLIHQEDSSIL